MHLALDTLFTAFLNIHVITVQTMPVSKFKEVGWSTYSLSDLLTSYQNHEMICLAKNYFLLFLNPCIIHFKFWYFPMLF